MQESAPVHTVVDAYADVGKRTKTHHEAYTLLELVVARLSHSLLPDRPTEFIPHHSVSCQERNTMLQLASVSEPGYYQLTEMKSGTLLYRLCARISSSRPRNTKPMFRVRYSEVNSHDYVVLQGLGSKLHCGGPEPRMSLSHASTEAVYHPLGKS
jgi:hypothetical protein